MLHEFKNSINLKNFQIYQIQKYYEFDSPKSCKIPIFRISIFVRLSSKKVVQKVKFPSIRKKLE